MPESNHIFPVSQPREKGSELPFQPVSKLSLNYCFMIKVFATSMFG